MLKPRLEVFRRKQLLAIMLIISLVGLVYAEVSWRIISNIFQWKTEVAKAQPLKVYPDPSTPLPTTVITGVAINVSIDVENPNPVTIRGWIMINFTKVGISLDDVSVYSDAKYNGYQLLIDKKGIYGNTLVFVISVNYIFDPYFSFKPGLNANVTYFYVQFNKEGTYDWSIAIIQ